MRMAKFSLHIIGFLFAILASAFQMALHLAMGILPIPIVLIVRFN